MMLGAEKQKRRINGPKMLIQRSTRHDWGGGEGLGINPPRAKLMEGLGIIDHRNRKARRPTVSRTRLHDY